MGTSRLTILFDDPFWIGLYEREDDNLFFRAEQEKREFGEAEMAAECDRLIPELRAFPGIVVAVLNEVGMGIVPESPLARRFRDCSGRCGQKIAAAADALYFTVCGIAQRIK